MSNIKIEHLSDTSDCETCGMSWAEGAIVYLNEEVLLEMIPHASCFGGDHWSESDIYKNILLKLGYQIDEGFDYGEN